MHMASWSSGNRVTISISRQLLRLLPPQKSPQHVTITSSGLSSSAKAGIGVGVAIGAISILLAFGLLIWRRRKRPKNPRGPLNTAELDSHSNYEMSGTDKLELDSNPLHEAGGSPKTHSSTQELVELDGTH